MFRIILVILNKRLHLTTTNTMVNGKLSKFGKPANRTEALLVVFTFEMNNFYLTYNSSFIACIFEEFSECYFLWRESS